MFPISASFYCAPEMLSNGRSVLLNKQLICDFLSLKFVIIVYGKDFVEFLCAQDHTKRFLKKMFAAEEMRVSCKCNNF